MANRKMKLNKKSLNRLITECIMNVFEASYYPLPAKQIKNITGISDDDELNLSIESEENEDMEHDIWLSLKEMAEGGNPSKHVYQFSDIANMLREKFGLTYSGPDMNNEGHEFKNNRFTLELFPTTFYEKQGTMNVYNMHVYSTKMNESVDSETQILLRQQQKIKDMAKNTLSRIGFNNFFGERPDNPYCFDVNINEPGDASKIERALKNLFGVDNYYDLSVDLGSRLGGSSFYCHIRLPSANKIKMSESKKDNNKIRLTEQDLYSVIRNSVKRIIKESYDDYGDDLSYDMKEFEKAIKKAHGTYHASSSNGQFHTGDKVIVHTKRYGDVEGIIEDFDINFMTYKENADIKFYNDDGREMTLMSVPLSKIAKVN